MGNNSSGANRGNNNNSSNNSNRNSNNSNRNSSNSRTNQGNRNFRNWKNNDQAKVPVKKDFKNDLKEQQLAHDFFKTEEEQVQDCPYCEKPVKYLNTAVTVANHNNPVHFDCIIKKIEEDETLAPEEKVTYLGKGTFGVIRITKDSPGFFIRKRIQVEEENEKAPWRKEMSGRIKVFSTPPIKDTKGGAR